MDQSFLIRARRLLDEPRPAPLDLSLLTAAVAARQASTPTARAQARCAGGPAADADMVAELLLAGPEWRRAAAARRGRFSRGGPKPGPRIS